MINTDKLIQSCDTITRNILFEGHDGGHWQKGGPRAAALMQAEAGHNPGKMQSGAHTQDHRRT